jgi:hypothetical protein
VSIVSTVVHSIEESGGVRVIRFRCTDNVGQEYFYGPVITSDPAFDPQAKLADVAAKVESQLAEREAEAFFAEEGP